MMEKIKAGEITGQTGDYMLRATAANGQIRAFAATSRDLVEKARNQKLDPVIGRDTEIRNVIRILSRKRGHDGIDDESGQ